MRSHLYQLLALFSLVPASMQAQAQASGEDTMQKYVEVPDARTFVAASQGGTVILASEGTKTSLIGRIGWVAASWSLGLSLEAPIEKPEEEEAVLADESGLAGLTVATVSVSRLVHVTASQADTSTCEEFNGLVLKIHRDTLVLRSPEVRVEATYCTPDRVAELGTFGENALKQSRAQALQATCDELAKIGLYNRTLDEKDRERAVAGKSPAPAYLPDACGTTDLREVEGRLALLENATLDFRSVAPSAVRAVDTQLERLKSQLKEATKVWDETAVGVRTTAARLALVGLKEEIDRLEAKVKSDAAKDPRTWYELELRKRLLAACAMADEVPLGKLVDVLDQNSPDKGCEVEPFQKAVAASNLPRREKARLSLEAQKKLLPRVLYWTAALSGGNQRFKYRKSATLEATEESKINRAFTGALTSATGIDGWTLGHSWRRVYKGGEKVQLCEQISGTTSSVCSSTALTPPLRDDKDRSLSFLEYRRYLSVQLAVGARAFYRHDRDQWGVRSTWFFLSKDKVGLDGGIDLGYDRRIDIQDASGKKTEVGGFMARLFVGRKFELFPLGK